MQYLQVTPHAALSNYVDAYWTASGSSAQHSIEKILPDGCVDIIFNLGNDCCTDNGAVLMKPEKTYLVGTMTRYKETGMDNNTKLLGVRFKPGAVSAFFKLMPLSEIANETVEVGNLLSIDIRKSGAFPFELLNRELIRNLNKPATGILMQIETVKRLKGQIKIPALAAVHCTTVRQLERDFKEHVGITPKEFVNLVRYQHAMKAIEHRKPDESLLSVAFDFGYYDHAHLTNDLKRYIGSAPTFF